MHKEYLSYLQMGYCLQKTPWMSFLDSHDKYIYLTNIGCFLTQVVDHLLDPLHQICQK